MSEAIKPIEDNLEEINIFDQELMKCPHAFYKKLRDEAPVYQDPNTGIFQVSKHELICEAARNAKVFSNDFGALQRMEDLMFILRKQQKLWKKMGTLLLTQCLLLIHLDIQNIEA